MTDQQPHTPSTEDIELVVLAQLKQTAERHGFPHDIEADRADFRRWLATVEAAAEQLGAERVLQAVMEVHKRKVLYKSNSGKTVTARCEHCYESWSQVDRPLIDGEADTFMWPCPTVQAITNQMEENNEPI